MAETAKPYRERIDHIPRPNGDVLTVYTITFPGGVVKRFEALTTAAEAKEVSGLLIGCCGNKAVGLSIFKRVGRLAKHVANSKVFALAAKGLALAGPFLGPIAPFALGAAAGLAVATKLAKAGVAAAHGAVDAAKTLTASAHGDALKLSGGNPAKAAALLNTANNKRLAAEKVADKGEPKSAPAPRAAPAAKVAPVDHRCPQLRGTTEADLLAAADLGRVKSNQQGAISRQQLLAAHDQGRIFWVQ
jgi:hypothetical protein